MAFVKQGKYMPRSWTLEERLIHHSIPEPNSGCLLWLAAVEGGGYASLKYKGKYWKAHRAAWVTWRGPIPKGLFVCHKCDVRSCINPNHLFIGTCADNNADKKQKGRSVYLRGERNGRAIIAAADVLAIRASTEPQSVLVARYGIQQAAISKIQLGKIWKHLLKLVPPQTNSRKDEDDPDPGLS